MPNSIHNLSLRYTHRRLSDHGQTPEAYTVASGAEDHVDAGALAAPNNYWAGALVRADSGDNAGIWGAVKSSAGDRVNFDLPFPFPFSAGDRVTLFLGGRFVSDQTIPGLTPDAEIPPRCSGFEIAFVSMANGDGDGVLTYSASAHTITWSPPDDVPGSPVLVGSLAAGDEIHVYGGGTSITGRGKYVTLRRRACTSLPPANAFDTIRLRTPKGILMMTVIGEETEAGVTIYRPVGLVNENEYDSFLNVLVYLPTPWPNAAEATVAGTLGTGAGTMAGSDLSSWPPHCFILNTTKDDCRYAYDRSGNLYQIMSPDGGIRGKTAVAWDDGDAIVVMPWQDVAVEFPLAGLAFKDPPHENAPPPGIVFGCPRAEGDAARIGDMHGGSEACIWERFFIPAGMQPMGSVLAPLRVVADEP